MPLLVTLCLPIERFETQFLLTGRVVCTTKLNKYNGDTSTAISSTASIESCLRERLLEVVTPGGQVRIGIGLKIPFKGEGERD